MRPGARAHVAYGVENTTQSCRQPLADPGVFGSALRCSSARVGTTRSAAVLSLESVVSATSARPSTMSE